MEQALHGLTVTHWMQHATAGVVVILSHQMRTCSRFKNPVCVLAISDSPVATISALPDEMKSIQLCDLSIETEILDVIVK